MDLVVFFPASAIAFVVGAAIGSFLNVVVYRLPAGLSLLYPPSRCPKCFTPLKPHDNIPVLGWLWLKGRCRYCKTRISPRYPVVEFTTGVIFLLIFGNFQFSLSTLGYWVFCSWLIALALIDADTMTLPNPLTASGVILGISFKLIDGWQQGGWSQAVNSLFAAIFAGVIGIWLFDTIRVLGSVAFGKTAMGGGDAKLAAMMGAWLGWQNLLLASFIACFLGAVVGGIMLKRRTQEKSLLKIPFGPYLAIGAILAMFFGEALISNYLKLFST